MTNRRLLDTDEGWGKWFSVLNHILMNLISQASDRSSWTIITQLVWEWNITLQVAHRSQGQASGADLPGEVLIIENILTEHDMRIVHSSTLRTEISGSLEILTETVTRRLSSNGTLINAQVIDIFYLGNNSYSISYIYRKIAFILTYSQC